MVRIVTAKPEHLDNLELKEVFEHKDAILYGKLAMGQNTPAFTILNPNGGVIGVIGGTFLYPGVLEVYGLFSNEIHQYKVSFFKTVKDCIDRSFGFYKVHRMQMVVKTSYEGGHHWAQSLGFKSEGVMQAYGPNREDYTLYARVS